jgi:hypothetical protein
MNLSKNILPALVQAPLASGGTDLASKYVDTQGAPNVLFTGLLGTAGSTDVCTLAAWGSSSTSSTGSALSGATMSSSAGESDKLMILDVVRPLKRYIKTHLTRSAAVEYGGTYAQRYGAAGNRVSPVSSTGSDLVSAPVVVAGAT